MDDGYHYDSYLRPNYEAWAAAVWIAGAAAALMTGRISGLPPEPFLMTAAAGIWMAAIRGRPAWKQFRLLRRLRGYGVEFIGQKDITRWVRRHPDRIWLGKGFDWEPEHAQRVQELLQVNQSRFPQPKEPTGSHWIHGVSETERIISVPLDVTKGHTLIAGTTRSGKSVMFRLLIAQCIARGEPVIIFDPKGDPDLKNETRNACEAYGRKFMSIHPAFPEDSVRLNLLANFARGTDLAGRIASIIPSESGTDPFVAFGHMALNNVVQGMLLIRQRPTLLDIRRNLEGGPEKLTRAAIAAWADHVIPGWESQASGYLAKANTEEKKAAAMIRFYRDRIQPVEANADLEGLISMFEHDREHFSKMIASLLPVLGMLTSSELGPLFSPRGSDPDDTREIVNLSRIVSDGNVLYVGLNSLADAQVGGAIGALMMADLAAVAADRYNYGIDDEPVNIFVDEASEAANIPFTQVLNKGGGAKLRMYVATQTVADFAAKLGSEDKAMQLLANLNNVISLRVLDERTQRYITDNLPKTKYRYVMRTQANSMQGDEPLLSSGNLGERLMEEEADIFPPQLLTRMPNLEYIARLANGRLVKGRIPILIEEPQKQRRREKKN